MPGINITSAQKTGDVTRQRMAYMDEVDLRAATLMERARNVLNGA